MFEPTDTFLGLVVVGLAAARVYQFWAHDSLTARLREWLVDSEGGWRYSVFHWVSCAWCAGFWWTVVVAVAWWVGSGPVDAAVLIVAAAEVASLVGLAGHRLTEGGDR